VYRKMCRSCALHMSVVVQPYSKCASGLKMPVRVWSSTSHVWSSFHDNDDETSFPCMAKGYT